MKRLTFKDSRGHNTLLINGQEYHGPIADRLAAYEETGLEPNEVSVFALDPEAFAKIVQIIIHHPLSLRDIADTSERLAPLLTVMGPRCVLNIRRWAVAYGEGRLIVLPCKVGDLLYEIDAPEYGVIVCKVLWIDSYMGPEQHVEGNKQIFTYLCCVEVIDGHGKGSSYSFAPYEFGESVFLTREAAEAALKGAADGDT